MQKVKIGSLEYLISDIERECSVIDIESVFDEYLDDTYESIAIFREIFYASEILRKLNYALFSREYDEWISSEKMPDDLIEINDNYYSIDEIESLCDPVE